MMNVENLMFGKALNLMGKNESRIMFTLVEGMRKLGKDQRYLKISNEPYMPLTIELVQDGVRGCPEGTIILSIAHYGQMNGDLMADPEMTFLVCDNEKTRYIRPLSWTNHYAGRHDECAAWAEDGSIKGWYNRRLDSMLSFSNMWMRNVKTQGFLCIEQLMQDEAAASA